MAEDPELKFLSEFTEQIIYRFSENTPRVIKCLEHLSETEIWYSPNESSNSAGTLVLHLCGNITQYIISGLGGEPDKRERDKEFTEKGKLSKEQLKEKLRAVTEKSVELMRKLKYDKLIKFYSIQGSKISGIAALIHVTEHYSYHTGQITLLTKLQKNTDTGFYKGLDLNKRNSE